MIISDTDILSSFAAAKGLTLFFDILHEDVIYIPPSVHRELRNDIACLNLAALLRLLWKDGLVSKAKVKTMMMRMTKVEGIVFKTTKEIFAD
ncbi:MAG: hypothetical protein WBW48_02100 [Anaerolineae bacterium]